MRFEHFSQMSSKLNIVLLDSETKIFYMVSDDILK